MTKLKSFLFPLFIACSWILPGCNSDHSISYQTLHIEGITWAFNISTSSITFGSTTESGESGQVSLPVSDGDLLLIMNSDNFELYYRYKIEDGKDLVITFDTVNSNSAYINGSLASFELSNEATSKDSFKGLSSSEVNQISTLYITDDLSDDILDVLKVHESSLRGTGVFLEGDGENGSLMSLLSICRPEWIGLQGQANLSEANNENFLGDLKLLWISEDIHAFSNMINSCTKLEDLIISNWEPFKGELLSLAELKNLRSLTLSECKLTDLSNIELPSSLKRLHLVACDTLTDVGGLNQVTDLESLSLSGSNNLGSLEEVNNHPTLKWMSFPGSTTQSAFLSLLTKLESLEVVELNQCELVSDLSRLKDMENLNTLIFNAEEYDLEQLANLDQLELIILNSALFEDAPEKISQLKAQLPKAEIVPGSGLCLGSGWLLLLLPLVLLARIIFRREPQFFIHR